jgi:uncharacterized protein (DUF427 family)
MTEKITKVPDQHHPITIYPNPARVVVRLGGAVLADSATVLTLYEVGYSLVHYFLRQDIDMTLLELTDHSTYCPYKGKASYFSAPIGGARGVNIAWSYEMPHAAVESIKHRIAFYTDRLDSIDEWERAGEFAKQ